MFSPFRATPCNFREILKVFLPGLCQEQSWAAGKDKITGSYCKCQAFCCLGATASGLNIGFTHAIRVNLRSTLGSKSLFFLSSLLRSRVRGQREGQEGTLCGGGTLMLLQLLTTVLTISDCLPPLVHAVSYGEGLTTAGVSIQFLNLYFVWPMILNITFLYYSKKPLKTHHFIVSVVMQS